MKSMRLPVSSILMFSLQKFCISQCYRKKGVELVCNCNLKKRGVSYLITPVQVVDGVLHDHEDLLFNQLQHMLALALQKDHHIKHSEGSFSDIGCKSNWHNFQEISKKQNSAHHFIKILK